MDKGAGGDFKKQQDGLPSSVVKLSAVISSDSNFNVETEIGLKL